ncbi:type III pantothenate kinase [Solemya elarraichensis gill symbiont]|uniref:Type III pantothenate kinase n=1 Tax=Solemya elarraichensis gill symbiont TaxID=1918949 RepID=A0A1T2L3N2_9GAMM|nr:type III pantothenate kinase [Solemya elarraichensis gill symbiont]OOZ39679.1 hypothetical protein BOW52_06980 [Solemya elarraichensis gill symbiont]
MHKLLFDIGNTRLKWALLKDGIMLQQQGLSHDAVNDDAISEIIAESGCEQLYVANVTGVEIEQRLRSIARQLGISEPVFIRTQSQAFDVTNAYDEPQRLGVDRWLAMVATRSICRQAFYVIDAGSAVTIDAVDAHGQHLGGLIAPGFRNMMNALVHNTNLSTDEWAPPQQVVVLENNTQQAMLGGCAAAVAGLISQQVPDDARLFLTGGDADWIAGLLDRDYELIEELVLLGVARYAEVA